MQQKLTTALQKAYNFPGEAMLELLNMNITGEQRNAFIRVACFVKYLIGQGVLDNSFFYQLFQGAVESREEAAVKIDSLYAEHWQLFYADAFRRLYDEEYFG